MEKIIEKEKIISIMKEMQNELSQITKECSVIIGELESAKTYEDVYAVAQKYEDFGEGFKHVELCFDS